MHRFYFSNRRRRLKIFGIPNHILSFLNDRLDFLNVIVISGMDVMDLLLGDKVHLLTDPMFLEAVENLLHYHVFLVLDLLVCMDFRRPTYLKLYDKPNLIIKLVKTRSLT